MNAKRDENNAPGLIAVFSNSIINIKANPATNRLKASDGTTGSNSGPTNSLKDENGVSSLLAVSSSDGVTPVVVYGDVDGNLLINSN